MRADNSEIRIDITGGFQSIRALVDSYVLIDLRRHCDDWKQRISTLLDERLEKNELSTRGIEIWNCMLADMAVTLKHQGAPN
ncbi:hypothetical protein EAE90_20720 [Photorhabdus caribbeanensis]|nr:hypothetical protein [Photorhabdus caribbeanensis]